MNEALWLVKAVKESQKLSSGISEVPNASYRKKL